MPDGVYTHETFLDNDRAGDEPLPIRVKVIVAGDEMTIDYSEHRRAGEGADQFRLVTAAARPSARVAFKYLMGADEMANEGTFRPLKLVLPPGKILSADPTAPMGNYSTPFPTVIDAVIKALETGAARARAGRPLRHPFRRPLLRPARRTARFFDTHDSGHGGWGACATHDGAGPFRTMAHGDTRIIPLELQESLIAVPDRGIRAARGFRRRRQISRRASASARATASCARACSDQPRPHAVSALGRAGRPGGARPGRFTLVRRPRPGASDRSRRRMAYPAAAGRPRLRRDRRRRRLRAAGRARRSSSSSATSTPATSRRLRRRRTMASRSEPTARRGDRVASANLCRVASSD